MASDIPANIEVVEDVGVICPSQNVKEPATALEHHY
jgi:hypothetical protein